LERIFKKSEKIEITAEEYKKLNGFEREINKNYYCLYMQVLHMLKMMTEIVPIIRRQYLI